jgi:hypothetical protein
MKHVSGVWHVASWLMQRATFFLLCALALGAFLYTGACLLGFANWFTWSAQFGDTAYDWAGTAVQCALTALVIGLCFFLPGHTRITALETSHRLFQIGMEDVARAYAVAHAADRSGAFKLSSEFDAVRERLGFLRQHPDLTQLEPEILEAAAQMSHISAELARSYSDDKVKRARQNLHERQHEIAQFNERLEQAKLISTELGAWVQQVQMDERVARAQLDRLVDDLAEVMPALGLEIVREGESLLALPHAAE